MDSIRKIKVGENLYMIEDMMGRYLLVPAIDPEDITYHEIGDLGISPDGEFVMWNGYWSGANPTDLQSVLKMYDYVNKCVDVQSEGLRLFVRANDSYLKLNASDDYTCVSQVIPVDCGFYVQFINEDYVMTVQTVRHGRYNGDYEDENGGTSYMMHYGSQAYARLYFQRKDGEPLELDRSVDGNDYDAIVNSFLIVFKQSSDRTTDQDANSHYADMYTVPVKELGDELPLNETMERYRDEVMPLTKLGDGAGYLWSDWIDMPTGCYMIFKDALSTMWDSLLWVVNAVYYSPQLGYKSFGEDWGEYDAIVSYPNIFGFPLSRQTQVIPGVLHQANANKGDGEFKLVAVQVGFKLASDDTPVGEMTPEQISDIVGRVEETFAIYRLPDNSASVPVRKLDRNNPEAVRQFLDVARNWYENFRFNHQESFFKYAIGTPTCLDFYYIDRDDYSTGWGIDSAAFVCLCLKGVEPMMVDLLAPGSSTITDVDIPPLRSYVNPNYPWAINPLDWSNDSSQPETYYGGGVG